jgi:16S rRNA G966 N2-methylase RsmD
VSLPAKSGAVRLFSTFVSGFESVIEELLRRDVPNVRILRLLDGAVDYETEAWSRFLPYMNNTFAVCRTAGERGHDSPKLERLAEDLIRKPLTLPTGLRRPRSFRLVASRENQLVSLTGSCQFRLIDSLSHSLHATFSGRQAEGEIWLLERREGLSYGLLRLTGLKRDCPRGELRPELATLLCEMSHPQPEDTVLDPFAGSGAIPLARSRCGGFHGIFAADKDSAQMDALKKVVNGISSARLRRSFFVRCQDFLENTYDDGFFSAIITDPPWGLYASIPWDFYPNVLRECQRLLKPEGRLILLSARTDLEQICPPQLLLRQCLHVLVSGKKAMVYAFVRE